MRRAGEGQAEAGSAVGRTWTWCGLVGRPGEISFLVIGANALDMAGLVTVPARKVAIGAGKGRQWSRAGGTRQQRWWRQGKPGEWRWREQGGRGNRKTVERGSQEVAKEFLLRTRRYLGHGMAEMGQKTIFDSSAELGGGHAGVILAGQFLHGAVVGADTLSRGLVPGI